MVERNGTDYAVYLGSVFHDDPDFRRAADNWSVEEVQHGDALGRWATLADPSWDYASSFQRYRDGYKLPLDAEASVRGSRTGELIARCMVETGTSSYYTALGRGDTAEPVLREVCRLIAADEYRHFKLFYDHMRRYLARERISLSAPAAHRRRAGRPKARTTSSPSRSIAATSRPRIRYDHGRCIASYMARAMALPARAIWSAAMGMIFKSVGLNPRGPPVGRGGTAMYAADPLQAAAVREADCGGGVSGRRKRLCPAPSPVKRGRGSVAPLRLRERAGERV